MYKALYRKWRPLTFDDVISQQHITDTLKNQLKSDKTAHAYLFMGSRGTGKTTCARIFAKAVNCPNTKDGNPCLECEVCREIEEGSMTDVVEIDAASNSGVGDVRLLRENTVYLPERCKYKVYIIDEVHMLSDSAFNALLKVMEEPPPYVKFILATTEIQKVPATIASRCQRFDFHRIKSADIAERLKYISSQENISLTPDGADMIARLADGGMRDAVSLLDQCSVSSDIIDSSVVSETAGIAGRDYLYDILEAVVASDTAKALSITAQLYDMSKDLVRLCEELAMQMRNAMLVKVSPSTAKNLVVCLPEEYQRLESIAQNTDIKTIVSRLEQLQECREHMKYSLNARIEFEMYLIKMCENVSLDRNVSVDNTEVMAKIKQLEKRVAAVPKAAEKREVLTATSPAVESEPQPNVQLDLKTVKPEDIDKCERWEEIMEEFRRINPACAGSLEGSTAGVKGNVLVIFTPNRFFMSLFKSNKDNAISLSRAIYNVIGQKYRISARCIATVEETRNMVEELIQKAKQNNIDVAVDSNSSQK